MVPQSALASAALCLLNDVAVLIREFPGGDLDEVDEPADPEQAAGEEIRYYNTRRVQRNLGVLTPMEKHTLCLAA